MTTMDHSVSNDDVALLKQTPMLLYRFLCSRPRHVLFQCVIDGEPIFDADNQSVIGFHYRSPSGTPGDVLLNYTIEVGTSAGMHNVGVFRVRKNVDSTGHIIYTNESPYGDVPIADGQYVTIIAERRIWERKIKRKLTGPIDFTEYMDNDIAYGGENDTFYPPITNVTRDSEGHPYQMMGFEDTPGCGYRTLDLSVHFSFSPVNPITSISWAFLGGLETVTGGGYTQESIQVQIPTALMYQGFLEARVSVLTATGISTRFFPIWTFTGFDDPHLITGFAVSGDTRAEGRDMDFTVWDLKSRGVNEGGLIGYFEVVTFGGDPAPAAYIDQFIGWATKDSVNSRIYRNTWTLSVGGHQTWLNSLQIGAQTVYDPRTVDDPTGTSNRYIEMPNNTPDKMIHYLLRMNTTALEVMNLYFSDYAPPIEGYTSQTGSLWSQAVGVNNRYFGLAACASDGSLFLTRHYDYLEDSERDAIPKLMSVDKRLWLDGKAPDFGSGKVPKVGLVDIYGSNYDVSYAPYVDFSRVWRVQAPGLVPGTGAGVETPPDFFLEKTISSLLHLRRIGGHHYDHMNAVYTDIPITLNGSFGFDIVEPAWGVPFLLTHTDANSRNLSFVNKPFLIKSISVNHSNDRDKPPKEITWTVDEVTRGYPGIAVDTTQRVDVDPTYPYTPPIYDGLDDQIPTKLIVFDTGGPNCHVALAWSPSTSSLVYSNRSGGLSGSNIWATANPYNYHQYLALQTTGLFVNQDPFGGDLWTPLALNSAMLGSGSRIGKFIAGSINRSGYFATLSGNVFSYTTDGGATWSHSVVTGGSPTYQSSLSTVNLFAISPYNNGAVGWIYCYIHGSGLYKSTNWGATWTLLHAFTNFGIDAFIGEPSIPYIRSDGVTHNINDIHQEIFTGRELGNEDGWLFSNDAAATWSLVYHVGASGTRWKAALSSTGWNCVPFTNDGSKLSIAGDSNVGEFFLRTSNDGGASALVDADLGNFGDSSGGHVNGSPVNSLATLAWSRASTTLFWTVDAGTTITSAAAPAGYSGVSYVEWPDFEWI